MTEVEFDQLLDAVQAAITPVPGDDIMAVYLRVSTSRPRAANDNGVVWPLIPFPAGWNAAS